MRLARPRRVASEPTRAHSERKVKQRMPAYHIWTEGCQMNVADSATLAAGLAILGWQPVDRPQDADLVVLNTCVVRQSAEDRAASKLGELRKLKARRPHLKIAVMGCMV